MNTTMLVAGKAAAADEAKTAAAHAAPIQPPPTNSSPAPGLDPNMSFAAMLSNIYSQDNTGGGEAPTFEPPARAGPKISALDKLKKGAKVVVEAQKMRSNEAEKEEKKKQQHRDWVSILS